MKLSTSPRVNLLAETMRQDAIRRKVLLLEAFTKGGPGGVADESIVQWVDRQKARQDAAFKAWQWAEGQAHLTEGLRDRGATLTAEEAIEQIAGLLDGWADASVPVIEFQSVVRSVARVCGLAGYHAEPAEGAAE